MGNIQANGTVEAVQILGTDVRLHVRRLVISKMGNIMLFVLGVGGMGKEDNLK